MTRGKLFEIFGMIQRYPGITCRYLGFDDGACSAVKIDKAVGESEIDIGKGKLLILRNMELVLENLIVYMEYH